MIKMGIKNKIGVIAVGVLIGYFLVTSFVPQIKQVKDSDKVLDVLAQIQAKLPNHYIASDKLDTNKIKAGKNLVTLGFTNPEKKSFFGRQSKHFVCTDCHNIEREDPNLKENNPDTRLAYVHDKKIKFLPATTLYGTVNKNHWYNDDYFKKYGELVVPARDTLENAIQLCAVVCSQGRALKEDEMEAMMHYLTSISYTIGDLELTDYERSIVSRAVSEGVSKKETIKLITSKYLDYSPATFMNPQKVGERGLGESGNLVRGKRIYELSCLTCHKEGGVTNYKLSNEQLTFKHLKFWSKTDKVFSVYNITRKGTYSKNGYKPYMPNYTKERLSDQQLEDLMAYIDYVSRTGKTSIPKVPQGTPTF